MLDVKRMRVLKEVAAQRSFSAAAQKLGYTQSAVSQQIAALEREAGSVLIERNPRGIRLTDAGEALVRHADKILARLAEAEDRKSTRLNSSHVSISYAVFCLKKKKK